MRRLALGLVLALILLNGAAAQEQYDDVLEIILLGTPVEDGGLGRPGANARVTETGEQRITENGEARIIE